jgi:hypothetical protein
MTLFSQHSRTELRRLYVDAWRKFRRGQALEPQEMRTAAVISEHPEYYALLEADAAALEAEFLPESGRENPFLHLGLHLAIREQVSTDRPAGITAAHARLTRRLRSAHEAEHRMLEVLGEALWEAQRTGAAPDENAYLAKIERL